jgi:hypothetical protein
MMMTWWMMVHKTTWPAGFSLLAAGLWSLAACLWVCQQQEASSQWQEA